MRHSPSSITAACAVLLLLLAGCEEAAPADVPPASPTRTGRAEPVVPEDPISGGTLRFAVAEPATVPFDATDPDSLVVIDALFDSLTAWAGNLALTASAAERWETPDGGRTWVFHLREGATFHDGATPVTAADFAFAWDTAVSSGRAGYHLRRVEGYEAVRDGEAASLRGITVSGRHTLRVRLQEPYGAFPWVVAHPALGPVARRLWEQDPGAFRRQPIGNGPFMAAEALVPGQFLRVLRYEAWSNAGATALLDEVLFQFMDPETAFVAFQQGRLQVSPLPLGAVPPALERYGRGEEGYRGAGVLDGDSPTVYFLAFDVDEPPFDDPDVRRAVSLAIDREALVESVLDGNASPATSLVLPAVSGVQGICEACRYDPREAARLFAEHGVESMTLWFNDDGGHRPLAQQVREDLRAAGVRRVSFRAPPFSQFQEVLEAGEAGFFRYGWQPEYPLGDDVLFPLFHSSGIPPRPEPDRAGEEPDEEPTGEPSEEPTGEPSEEPTGEPSEEPTDPAGEERSEGPGDDPTGEPGQEPVEPTEAPAGSPGEPGRAEEGPGEEATAEAGDPAETRNYMGYADAEVDRLLADARATTSMLRRLYYHRRVEDIALNRDQVVVPILFYRHQRVVGERVVGLAINPMGLIDLHRVQLRRDPAQSPPED